MDETDAGRWAAIVARDPMARFIFGVARTGICCRPGCPARTPLRRNVRVFAHPQAAGVAGFRACRRCAPDQMAQAGNTQPSAT